MESKQEFALKPGVLVVVKSSVRGGAEYDRQELSTDGLDPAGAKQIRSWQTVQRVSDPDELAEARRVRGYAVGAIWNRASVTPYGLIVSDDRLEALAEAVERARERVDAFNAKARHVRVTLRVLKTRLVPEEASEAFEAEAEETLEDLEARVDAESLDVEETRKAADRATALAEVLDGSLASRVLAKIQEARAAATAAAREARGDGGNGGAATAAKKKKNRPKKADAELLEKAAARAGTAELVARAARSKVDALDVGVRAAEERVAASRTEKQREAADAAFLRAVAARESADKKAVAAERRAAELEAERAALAGEETETAEVHP